MNREGTARKIKFLHLKRRGSGENEARANQEDFQKTDIIWSRTGLKNGGLFYGKRKKY